MADFEKVAEHYPAIRESRDNELFSFRGDVLSYWANANKASFSTDAQGFRHSTLAGKNYSVVECMQSPRYGLALGPSTFFGTGLDGNDKTLASRLAERFGFPVANAAMPGGNSRNLNALLFGLLAAAKQPPAVVVLSNGGDLANFCGTGFADAIFGSPNRVQMKGIRESGQVADPEAEFRKLMVFTRLWTSATASLCRARNIPLVLVHQSTFFEKQDASPVERECRLGEPGNAGQQRLFAAFRLFNSRFFEHRRELANGLGLPLPGVDSEQLEFIDEFHLNAGSLKLLSDAVGDEIAPLIGAAKPKSRKKAQA